MKSTILDGELFFQYDGKTYTSVALLKLLNRLRGELLAELSAARKTLDQLTRQFQNSLIDGNSFERGELRTARQSIRDLESGALALQSEIDAVRAQAANHGGKTLVENAEAEISALVSQFDFDEIESEEIEA